MQCFDGANLSNSDKRISAHLRASVGTPARDSLADQVANEKRKHVNSENVYHYLLYQDAHEGRPDRRWDMSHDNNEGHEVKLLAAESAEAALAEVAPAEVVAVPQSGAAAEQPAEAQSKSVSPAKLAANRANAQRSTGPKTPEGKAKSKENSRKHGFFATQPLPNGPEGDKLWEAYSDLYLGIFEHYQPVGYMESLLTEKIAAESIRFSRLLAFESVYIHQRHAFHGQGVDRVLRYQAAINRQLFQAIHELERMQVQRKANRSDGK